MRWIWSSPPAPGSACGTSSTSQEPGQSLPAEVDPETLRAAVAQVGSDRVLISSLAYAPHRLASVHAPHNFQPEWTEAFRAAFPAPGPLPESDDRQEFYGLENGAVVPLR